MSAAPVIHGIKRRNGVAGQFSLVATVEYPGEGRSVVEFVGSVYGGPVIMVTPSGHQIPVRRPGLGEKLTPAWVRVFFTPVSAR